MFNASCEIYSISKESKYKAKFLSINNETQRVPLLSLSARFITLPHLYSRYIFSEKTPLNLGL